MVKVLLLSAAVVIGLVIGLFLLVDDLAGEEDRVLMVHTADSGSLVPGVEGTFVLTLSGVDEVIWFLDHPGRDAGRMTVGDLVGIVTSAASDDALNATLEADGYLYPLELLEVSFGDDGSSVRYVVTSLEEPVIEGPSELRQLTAVEFGAAALFIDAEPTSVNSQVTD